MQLRILRHKSPSCLKISLFAFCARPVNFNGKCSKLLFQWYKSTVKPIFRITFDTFRKSHLLTSYGNIVQIFCHFFPLRFTFAQHFLLSAENIYFLHKMCEFAQNFSFFLFMIFFYRFKLHIFSSPTYMCIPISFLYYENCKIHIILNFSFICTVSVHPYKGQACYKQYSAQINH